MKASVRATGRIIAPARIELEFSRCSEVTANQRGQRRWYFYDHRVPKMVWTKDKELHGRRVATVLQDPRRHLVTSSGGRSGARWE